MIKTTETRKMSVEMALISGVMPRRRRPQISSGQSIVAADEKESDGDFVHGEGEDQQAGGDERKFEVGQSDAPESLQRRGAEIERGFFLGAIHFLEAGEELGGGNGDERGAVTEKYGEQAEMRAGVARRTLIRKGR